MCVQSDAPDRVVNGIQTLLVVIISTIHVVNKACPFSQVTDHAGIHDRSALADDV